MTNTAYATKKFASAKQIAFIKSLAGERVIPTDDTTCVLTVSNVVEGDTNGITSSAASKTIAALLAAPKAPQAAEKPAVAAVTMEPGKYIDPATGNVYSVVKSANGNLYAKVLQTSGKKGTFVYAPGAMKGASKWLMLTLEDAAQFGKKTGVCCMCGRGLTVTASIEAGIGPICAGKF